MQNEGVAKRAVKQHNWRSLNFWLWSSILWLLFAPNVLAETETKNDIEKKTTVNSVVISSQELKDNRQELLSVSRDAQDLLSQAENNTLTKVTGVEVKQTQQGLQLILTTPPGQAKLVPLILPVGNNLEIELLDATLAFSIRNGVTKTNPAPGISEVRVSKVDATSIRVTIAGAKQVPKAEVVPSGQNLVLSVTPSGVTAQSKPEQEIEIVVTGQRAEDNYAVPNSSIGTRTDAAIKDVPQSIQVIPQQVLKDQGETDFEDALRNTSGVSQAGSGSFLIRGFNGFDSVRRNGADAGLGTTVQNFSLADAEQIEVLKGPAAVLYGSGEPGGIVNITTKQPSTEPSYELQGIIGNFDFYRPSLDITGPLNEDKTILYRFNAFYENSGSFIDFVENEEFGFYPVLSFQLGENTTLTLEGNYRQDTSNANLFLNTVDGLPARGTVLPNPEGEIPRSRYLGEPDFNNATFTEWNIGYRLDHRFSDNWSIKNSFTANIIDRDGQAVRPSELLEDNRTLSRGAEEAFGGSENYTLQTDVSGKVRTGIVQHDLLVGVELARNNNETTFLLGEAASLDIFNPVYGNLPNPDELELEFGDRSTDDTIGVYAQDLLSIGKKVKVLVGGRLDWNFSEFTEFTTLESGEIGDGEKFEEDPVNSFSPRVGIVYQPIEPVSLYGSYSSFFLPSFGTDRLGEPLKPVTGNQFEVGVKGEFFDGRASATLAAFQINRRNDPIPDPVDPDNFNVQLGETRSRGIELDLTGEVLPGLKLITTYALTDNQITEDTRFGFEGNIPRNVPLHSGSIWAVYEVPKGYYQGFGIGGGVFAVGERQAIDDNTFTIPAYGRVDALLYYRRDNWKAQLNFENLFDEDYIESAEDSVTPGAPFTVKGQLSAEF